MSRISSAKYLSGSKGQECSMRIPGHCVGGTETTVPAHIRDRHKGGGNKASDISVANACFGCHSAFDTGKLTHEEWLTYALRGLQETLEQRHEAGLLIVPIDPKHAKTIKPRKPAEKRTAIPKSSRPFASKPLVSRGRWPKKGVVLRD